MTSPEADIAVLKEQVAEIIRDGEKRDRIQDERRKLDDARHEAVMAQLQQLQLTIASGKAFVAGGKFTVGALWALLGGVVAYAAAWLVDGWKG